METMQFDEKDSLSAMAFVVAGQQKTINGLQQDVERWRAEYKEASDNFSSERTDNIALRDKINNLTRNYEKEIEGLKACSKQQQEQTDIYRDKAEELYNENCRLSERSNAFQNRLLRWRPYTDQCIGIRPEDFQFDPCILILTETVKEGTYSNGNPIPVGALRISAPWVQQENGQYYIPNGDAYVNIIAWCIVDEENFITDNHDTDTTDKEGDV